MMTKELDSQFSKKLTNSLLKALQNDNEVEFLKENPLFQELLQNIQS